MGCAVSALRRKWGLGSKAVGPARADNAAPQKVGMASTHASSLADIKAQRERREREEAAANGGTPYCQVRAARPGAFSLSRALEMAEISDIVYLRGHIWASSKAGEHVARKPEEMSATARYYLGDLARLGLGPQNRLGLQDLGEEYNDPAPGAGAEIEGKLTVYNGMMYDGEQDTQGLFMTHDVERFVVLSMRGTSSLKDFQIDVQGVMREDPTGGAGAGKVHGGNAAAYGTVQKKVLEITNKLFATGRYDRLFVTGHSLGGALATLAAKDIAANWRAAAGSAGPVRRITAYTFGSPSLGDQAFAHEYNDLVPETWRCVQDQDIVPSLNFNFPVYKYAHVGTNVFLNEHGLWINPKDEVLEVETDDGTLMELLNDHFITGYRELLLNFEATLAVPAATRDLLNDIWSRYLRSKERVQVVMCITEEPCLVKKIGGVAGKAAGQALGIDEDHPAGGSFYGGPPPPVMQITPVRIHVPDAAALKEGLTKRLDPPMSEDRARLLDAMMRELNHRPEGAPCKWRHFFSAVYKLHFHAKEKEYWKFISELRTMFDKHDLDADGFLYVTEFENFAAAHNKGVPLTKDEVAKAVRKFDVSMDGTGGRLSFGEVVMWCWSVAGPSSVAPWGG